MNEAWFKRRILHCFLNPSLHIGIVLTFVNTNQARFKCRILHAPNRIAKLTACKMRRLNPVKTRRIYYRSFHAL